MRASLVLLLFVAGCHRAANPGVVAAPDLCAKVTEHLISTGMGDMKLGFVESLTVGTVKSTMAVACRKKGGVTEAQAQCILDAKTSAQLEKLADCPALKANPIPWLQLGATDAGLPADE